MTSPMDTFIEEAYELIAELETSLLDLEETPEDKELIDKVFRAMHTIKGSSGMFGFDNISSFTHELETAFDLVREGRLKVNNELVNLALSARDQIKSMVDAAETSDAVEAVDGKRSEEIIEDLKALMVSQLDTPSRGTTGEEAANGDAPMDPVASEGDGSGIFEATETTYRIRYAPHPDTFKNGTNPLLLLKELDELGSCSIIAQTHQIPDLNKHDPETCYVYWDIVLTTTSDINTVKDVFIFVEDTSEISIEPIDSAEETADDDYKKIGEILVERGDITNGDINQAVSKQKRLGEMLINDGKVDRGSVDSALLEQEHVRKTRQQRKEAIKSSSIRVSADKLDTLVDLVGELVTVQARLSQKATFGTDPDLLDIAEVVERLTAELRDNTMSIRMLPIGSIFSNLKRLVRDLSRELGKDVMMETDGGDTELDKTIIEQLNDPLVHIIRNCIDHGIEPPDEREAANKTKQGKVKLSAEHSGAYVLIKITDDGAGLDPQVIRQKAVEKGLITPETEKSDKEVFSLIFAPGFSTAVTVTNVSGRGVGMDVVKRGIDGLRGSVEIDSAKGAGTTITLKLPLTLAIIDGLLVETSGDRYVLPLAAIEECVELTREDVAKTHGRNILNIRGDIVPYVELRDRFDIPGSPPDIEQVVINEMDGQRIGIVVDRVIGEHQIVIKTMSKLYRNVEEVSGATILGDGSVALILDIPKLIELGAEQIKRVA